MVKTAENFEQSRKQAEATLTRKLSAQTLGKPGAEEFLNATVTIDTGLQQPSTSTGNNSNEKNETIRLTITSPQMELHTHCIRDAVEKTIQQLEPLDEWVRARSPEQEIHYVKTKMAELKEAGANIPETAFKWAGFDTRNEQANEVPEYLVTTIIDSEGVGAGIRLPAHLPPELNEQKITDHLNAHQQEMKDILAARIIKYKNAAGQDALDIKEKVSELQLNIRSFPGRTTGEDSTAGRINIAFQTPAQKAYYDALSNEERRSSPTRTDLMEGNILSSLAPGDLAKALSRAIQTAGGEKSQTITPVIMGAADMRRNLEKTLSAFEKEHPELHHQVADILNSPVLTRSPEQREKHFIKHPVVYTKDATPSSRNTMTVEMIVPEGKATGIVEQLAQMSAATAEQTASQPFASVDSMELIGAAAKDPAIQAKLQAMLAPMLGKPVVVNGTNNELQNFTAQLIAAIEKTHQTIEQGMKAGAAQSTPGAQPFAEKIIQQVNEAHQLVQGHSSQTPSPVMSPSWVQRLVQKTHGDQLQLGA